MSIKMKDVQKLWGLSAGSCSAPDCANKCVEDSDNSPIMLAEMAHVIAKSPLGARGNGTKGEDNYENLILLCPYHHALVDKEPTKFPKEMLLEWKRKHEEKIAQLCRVLAPSKLDLLRKVSAILYENKQVWQNYGPDSDEAKENPLSSTQKYWFSQKMGILLPNNRSIIELMEFNRKLLSVEETKAFVLFKVHALAFESSAFYPIEFVPRFPKVFEECIYAKLECHR